MDTNYQNLSDKNFISGVIDRFEGDMAVVSLADGQKLDISRQKLPADIKEGASLKFKIQTDKDEEMERNLLAKSLLNEIFKISQ